METLVIVTDKEKKTFLINTNSKVAEKVINSILDTYSPKDWWMEDGWILE